MWHDGHCLIYANSGVLVVGDDVVYNVLKYEEKQSDNDADFGTSDEYLNEETLNNEKDIEKYKDYERNYVGNILENT